MGLLFSFCLRKALLEALPGGLDRPSVEAWGGRAGRGHVRGAGWPRGDRAHGANHPETMTCMNFKAPKTTKRLLYEPNHLHHAQDGI